MTRFSQYLKYKKLNEADEPEGDGEGSGLVGQFNDLLKKVKATTVYTPKDAPDKQEASIAKKANFKEWMKSKGKVL